MVCSGFLGSPSSSLCSPISSALLLPPSFSWSSSLPLPPSSPISLTCTLHCFVSGVQERTPGFILTQLQLWSHTTATLSCQTICNILLVNSVIQKAQDWPGCAGESRKARRLPEPLGGTAAVAESRSSGLSPTLQPGDFRQ